MNRKIIQIIICFALFFTACSSERNTFTNRLYHNTTARYNAYYLSNAKILDLETQIRNDYQEDFSQVLPIFYPIDSSTIERNEELLKDARELASKAIDWHRISKWRDDSYYLIGMVDYYQAEFDDATNTFKYVNVNSKDKKLRHRSLIQLLRIFVDLKKYEDAAFVIDYLSKESGIKKENLYTLYKTLAYYYHQRGETNGKIAALDKALDYTKDKKEKSRLNFILAQLYQREGLDALAYNYYKEAQKGNPPYERSFFAQLFAQQVAELNKSKDLRRVRSYYDDLYKDSKNRDLRDVVLYEKALFELKQEDIEEAQKLLIQAAKEPGKNPVQKGYIYQKLAELSFDIHKDYRASKYYLDSALSHFKPSDNPYVQIMERKSVLDDYVTHFEAISLNDSLLHLSRLSPEEQELIAEAFIKSEEERLLREAAEKEKPKSSGLFDNLLAFSGRGTGENFYFDNAVALQQGAIDFYRNWGNRPLQDNWRRSSQGFQSSSSQEEESDTLGTETENITEAEEEGFSIAQIPDKESLLQQIPKTDADLTRLNEELELSYFELGKLLFFDLKEPEISIDYLERLITTFPDTGKKPEAYYLLYLAQKELNRGGGLYAERLNREFPDSPFTFSVNNPNRISGTEAYLASAEQYNKAYDLYYKRQYDEARSIIRFTMENYPLTRNTNKLILLDIMISGKIDPRERFQTRLENFIQNTEDEGLSKMARNMLVALTGEKPVAESERLEAEIAESENGADQADQLDESMADAEEESPYKDNPNQTHIFVIALEPEKAKESKGLLADLESFHTQNFANSRLRTGNMNLNRENAIFIVSPFSNAARAEDYKDKFIQDFHTAAFTDQDKNNCFLISISNFQELNKRKDIQEYRDFYNKTYK